MKWPPPPVRPRALSPLKPCKLASGRIGKGACTVSPSTLAAFADAATCPPGEDASQLVITPDGDMAVLRHGRLEETIATFRPTPDDFWVTDRFPVPTPENR